MTQKLKIGAGTTHTHKNPYLGFQTANLDGTKSALMEWDAARMNLADLGSTRDVGVEICDPKAQKLKQGQLTHKKNTYLGFKKANLDGTKSNLMAWDVVRMKLADLGSTRDVGLRYATQKPPK